MIRAQNLTPRRFDASLVARAMPVARAFAAPRATHASRIASSCARRPCARLVAGRVVRRATQSQSPVGERVLVGGVRGVRTRAVRDAANLSTSDESSGESLSSSPNQRATNDAKVAVSQWPPPATSDDGAPTSWARLACIAIAYCSACYATLALALYILPALGLGSLPSAADAIGAFPRGALEFPPKSVPGALRFMDLFGTAMYAHAGTITAGTRGMDLMGCLIVGCLTAMSGGTIRQVLTGETPVFWCASPEYLATALAASALTFWLWPKIREEIRLSREMNTVLNITDALALGCFTVVGANAAQRLGFGVLVGVVCGVITSCSGGVLRDICCAQPIRIMHSQQELYAVCVAAGSMAFLLIANYVPGASLATRVAFPIAVVVVLRFFAWTLGLVLPRYADKQPFGGISTRLVL